MRWGNKSPRMECQSERAARKGLHTQIGSIWGKPSEILHFFAEVSPRVVVLGERLFLFRTVRDCNADLDIKRHGAESSPAITRVADEENRIVSYTLSACKVVCTPVAAQTRVSVRISGSWLCGSE